jgi:nuclear pore complex protein Nup98-Nup96
VYKRKKQLKKLETKEKVSNWWSNLVSPIIQKNLKSQEIKNSQDPIDLIWLHLTGHNLEEASDLAFTSHNPRLASLLIQAGGEGEFREYINLQIKSWHTEHCLEFIDSKKRKIYELLQGNMNPYLLATGHFDEICKGLDWRRSFGLFIWYIGLYENDLAKCLNYYDRCMQKWIENKEEDGVTTVGMKNSLPFPWYDTLQSFLWKNREHYDVLYHMLHLGINSKYSLEKLLHPLGITSNSLDFRLSWQLALILTKQVGIGKFESEPNPNYCMDRLTVLFINQLLGLKLWRWAIFASCYLSNAKCRSQMIRHILARNIEPQVDFEFQQILQGVDIQTSNTIDVTVSLKDLRIPSIWIEDSFANLYAYQGRFRDELLLLLKVKKFDKAYYVFLTKLGPDMLMNRAFEEIVGILSKFPSEKVKRWDYGGKYYLKLSQLMLQYNEIQANATEEDDIQIVVDLETSLQVLITDLNSLEKNQGFTSNTRPEIDSKLRARMVDQIVDSLTYLRKLLGSCSFKDLGDQPINLSRSRKIDQSLELGRVFFNDN